MAFAQTCALAPFNGLGSQVARNSSGSITTRGYIDIFSPVPGARLPPHVVELDYFFTWESTTPCEQYQLSKTSIFIIDSLLPHFEHVPMQQHVP